MTVFRDSRPREAMPTCWDESKGIGVDDPTGHMAYTTDGTVGGPCPAGHDQRVPQVQLFVRIRDYRGGTYRLSDGGDVFHVDFMNGWREGALEEILERCAPSGVPGYNPPCDCADRFLTANEHAGATATVCDADVRRHVIDEETATVTAPPRGACRGARVVPKSWDVVPPFDARCGDDDGGGGEQDEEDESDEDESEEEENEDSDEEGRDEDESVDSAEEEESEESRDEDEEEESGDSEEEESGDAEEEEASEDFDDEEEQEDEEEVRDKARSRGRAVGRQQRNRVEGIMRGKGTEEVHLGRRRRRRRREVQ